MGHVSTRPASPKSIALADAYEQGTDADAQIFHHYYERLVRLIKPRIAPAMQGSVDAEDLAQSVIWQTLRVEPEEREVSTNNGSLWPLLAIKAIRRVYRAHRDATAQKRSDGNIVLSIHAAHEDEGYEADVADEGTSAEDEAAFNELKTAALNSLTSRTDRRVFELHLDGYSSERIMNELGCSSRTVNRSLQHAQEAMIKELEKWAEE